MTKTKSGNIVIIASLMLTTILWLSFQFKLEEFPTLLLIQINQITALLGTLLISWSMFLMTRLNILEKLFGGLDKTYKTHKKVSIWGMAMIVIHVVSLAIQRIPNFSRAINIFFPVHNQVYINLGAWSFWLFVFFVVITLLMKRIKLPHHVWRYLHKATGIALILAFLHIVLIPGNITSSPILNMWLLLTTGTGIASWIYFEFFYKLLAPNYFYRVTKITKDGDVFKIQLNPVGQKMAYKPGQFAYLSFVKSEVSKEIHPFTITSHPDENELTFAVKVLGDYTKTLDRLKIDDTVRIWGPHGTFADKFLETKMDSVFIGGGIGIAPFISMAKEAVKPGNITRNVALYYCTKFKRDACFDYMLAKNTEKTSNYCYLNKCSQEGGRLSAPEIVAKMKNVKNTLVFICGPSRMVNPLAKDLRKKGVLGQNIITENFDLV